MTNKLTVSKEEISKNIQSKLSLWASRARNKVMGVEQGCPEEILHLIGKGGAGKKSLTIETSKPTQRAQLVSDADAMEHCIRTFGSKSM